MRLPVRLGFKDENGASQKVDACTLVLNKHGARIECKRSFALRQELVLTVVPTKKSATGNIVWREANSNASGNFEFAVELQESENLWGIDFPPSDWYTRKGAAPAKAPEAGAVSVASEQMPPPPEAIAEAVPAPEVAVAALSTEESPSVVLFEAPLDSLPEFPVLELVESPSPPIAEPMPEPQPMSPASAEHLDLTAELPDIQVPPPVMPPPTQHQGSAPGLPLLSRHMSGESFNATAAALLNALVSLLERQGYVTREHLYDEMDRLSH